jgi:hypothetical protein
MTVLLSASGCQISRETGDKLASKESNVAYWMKLCLNREGYNFVRINPSRYGLTSCKLGIADWKRGIVLWHERYAVENAATEFNKNHVWFTRTNVNKTEVA